MYPVGASVELMEVMMLQVLNQVIATNKEELTCPDRPNSKHRCCYTKPDRSHHSTTHKERVHFVKITSATKFVVEVHHDHPVHWKKNPSSPKHLGSL